jgi:hypothetical protein
VRSIGKAFDYSFSNLNFWWYYVSYCYRGFDKKKEITNSENHSVRNVEKYPRYRENVTLINQAIDLFEQQTSSQ